LSYETTGAHRLIRVTEPAGRFFQIRYGNVGTASVLSSVSTNDGRIVEYTYQTVDSHVELTGALYDDATSASYIYTHSGTHPLLAHAIDPRLVGPATNLQYTYVDDSGFASQELNGITGQ